MRRAVALLVSGLLLAGCVSSIGQASPTVPPNFSAPLITPAPPTLAPGATPTWAPSGSCIFTLDVSNESSGPVIVQINTVRVATIPPQATKRFMDHGAWPEMPWEVVLIRASDGANLGQASFTSDQLDGHMTARDQEVAQSARQCAPA